MSQEVLAAIKKYSQLHPDRLAIVTQQRALTYSELMDAASRLAVYILQNGLQNTGLIGVYLSHCYELPISLLAVWMTGAAYVPLDPIYPKQRVLDILNRVDVSCVLTTHDALTGHNVLNVEDLLRGSSLPLDDNYLARMDEKALSYVIFTSGTTGVPKGVEIRGESLWNVLTTFQKALEVSPQDRLLSITAISFDIFALELFLPLISGGTCYFTDRMIAIDPDLLLTCLQEHQITLFQATPATFQSLINESWPKLSLRHILCGGESWDQKLALGILNQQPATCSLWNVYGPTETTIWSSLYQISSGDDIYITPAVENTDFYILDENLKPVDEGILYIGGMGVANGYYKDAALTADRFIYNPFDSGRLYKTGDRVRRHSSKTYQFIGREDQQVKIRGFRVELGDVEHALLKHPQVSQVVVFYTPIGEDSERSLVACLEIKAHPKIDFRSFLSEFLPTYMIPQHFLVFDSLPLSPNLKTDRKQVFEQSLKRLSV